MKRLAALALVVLSGCSSVLARSNAGIPLLERDAPGPTAPVATGAKYAGWVLGGPLTLALAPIGALAWATPWVELDEAADLCTAPSIACGYLLQAVVGFPVYAASSSLAPVSTADLGVPYGLVVAHEPPGVRAPEPVTRDLDLLYAPPPEEVARLSAALAVADREESPACIRLAALAATLEVSFAEGDEPRPLVFMTPPSQGTFAARWLAARYARRGIHAAVIVPDEEFVEPRLSPAELEEKLRVAVTTARAAITALARRASRVEYLGISAGGVFGSILAAVEPRIDRFALVFPGGDLPRLLATSEESTVCAYREAWAERGFVGDDLARELAGAIRTDPVLLARHVDPARVLLFLSDEDTMVPIACGRALRDALGRPETWLMSGDHESASLAFGFVLARCEEFLGL